MTNFGYIESPVGPDDLFIDDNSFGNLAKSLEMPLNYSYLNCMSEIRDQGSTSTCVPQALSAVYDYWWNMKHPNEYNDKFKQIKFPIDLIYNLREGNTDGMTYKNAFEICKENKKFKKKYTEDINISKWARVNNIIYAKRCILMNGPILISTLVYNQNQIEYWKNNGRNYIGGHAVSLIGYDDKKEAFILRNSWGTSYGDNGYAWFPYEDFNKVLECWTCILG